MNRLRALPLSLALAACATARQGAGDVPAGPLPMKHAPAPTVPAITAADLMTRLYVLADDSMLGREAGQLGNVKGTDYVAGEFRKMGLTPAGDDGTFFQTVPLVITRADTGAAGLAVAGAPLVLGRDYVALPGGFGGGALPPGGTTRPFDGAPVVYGGPIGGTLLPPAQAAGKLVLFTAPTDASGQPDWRAALQGALVPYGDAAAIAVAALDGMPPNTRNRLGGAQEHLRAATAGIAPVTILVTAAAASRLLGGATPPAPGTAGAAVTGHLGFTDYPSPYPPRNVVAILPGSDPRRAGEYVAIGAHNDHIGLTPRPLDHDSVLAFNMVLRRQGVQDPVRVPTAEQAARIARLRDSLTRAHGGPRADSVNNGADDDGSGTVSLLEIAQRFATEPQRPRRSILFVSHTGEEKGLLGSQWFTDHPTVPRDSIVAQLNMDMVGRGKPADIMGRGPNNIQMIGSRRLSTQLGALIDSINANRTPHMDVDSSFDTHGHPLNRYCRSDHYMYARYGIPITYFSLGYHTDYHQVTDEPQYIDYEHMARIAQFVHDIADAIADRPERLVVDQPKPDPHGGCRQ